MITSYASFIRYIIVMYILLAVRRHKSNHENTPVAHFSCFQGIQTLLYAFDCHRVSHTDWFDAVEGREVEHIHVHLSCCDDGAQHPQTTCQKAHVGELEVLHSDRQR